VIPPRRPYATDLTDAEWQLLAPLIPAPKLGGRPPLHDRRELVNAMAYWRGCCPMTCRLADRLPLLPQLATTGPVGTGPCHPPHPGADPPRPSAHDQRGHPDSQSGKTTERGRHGYDGAKRLNGRKRHLLVDTSAWSARST
jgi:putative transposase